MLVARSVVLNNNIVGRMMEQQQQQDDDGGNVVVGVVKIEGCDVEEGEISDSASVEEISADDFNKQEEEVVKAVVVKPKETSTAPMKPKVGGGGETRVWTMQDLFSQYPMSRGYATGLYNFAWAQAVQNKPLNEVYVMDVDDSDESSKRVSSSSSSAAAADATTTSSGKEEEGIVINVDSGDEMDVNIEEGELEEGEIDMDSEPAAADGDVGISNVDSEDGEDLKKQLNSIREALESVSVVEAEKSFNAVCSRLQSTLETLQVVLKNIVPAKDALIQLSFSGIQALNSVFRSFNSIQKEQNNEIFSRLISVVINQDPPIFPSERMKEIEAMVPVVNSSAVLSSAHKEREKLLSDEVNQHDSASSAHNAGQNVNSAKMFVLDSLANQLSSNKSDFNMLSEASKPGLSSLRARGAVAPLLDLHKDHDSDSLPSPTRENQPYFLLRNSLAVGEGMPKPESATTFKSLATREEMPKPEPVTTFKSLMAVGERMPKPESVTAFKSLAVGEGMPKSESVAAFKPESATAPVDHKKVDGSMMHHYETEAVKAVSTYQQKFGRASFLSNDRLPSPTPSEESVDKGDDDTTGEVSSSYDVANFKNSKRPISGRPISSPAPHMNSTSVQGLISASDAGPVSSVTNSTLKASAKSRDPRIRFATSTGGALKINQHTLPVVSITPNLDPFGGTVKSRRNKTVEDPMLDGPAYKRQRNGSTDSDLARDVKTVSGSGGWLEDAGTVGPKFVNRNHLMECTSNDLSKVDVGVTYPSTASNPSIVTSGIEQVPVYGTNTISTTPPIPALFKDIVVNPTMLLNLLKMGQEQRLSAEVQQKPADPTINSTHPPISNSLSGVVPLANVTSLKPLALSQSQAGTLQVPSQGGPMNLQDDVAKIRMKPRDPRRFLHSNTIQNSTDQLKTNGAPTLSSQGNKENVNSQKLEDQADTNSTSSQSVAPPDIARQFTKNLKNIADLMSFPQTTVSSSVVSQSSLIVPVQPTSDKVDAKDVKSESDERQSGTASLPGESVAGPLKSQNTWGDVEHLFEGFDDQQKAAIQRERARRLEEQKKMFAARKLCLVLDLDHTLLNSAKFVEVDPVHDEILRKKEEQDREKPHRHLFRFPYMGMWTKLRPGVWNFLEEASRLFELHLYTMGNKLYATEMAKVLDPKGDLFAGRVISRGDDGDLIDGDERIHKSKDLEGVLGMESAVVIIDDSVRVWPHNKLNLIVVERYTYFPCSRRQFGLPGPSLLEIDHDERPEDGTLASCSAVIEKIHQNFFSHRSLDEVDVRNILASEQRKILAGCRIVFSRVFPVGEANPHLHPLWQTAEQFGAVCTNQIDEQVTHVVANSLGTDKVNWALSTGRFVVHPGWVEASALLYRRVNEQDFAIKQ